MSINNYGSQFLIADEFYSKALKALRENGISLATSRLSIRTNDQDDRLNP